MATGKYSVGIQVLDGTNKVLVDRVCCVPLSTQIGELLADTTGQADQPNIDNNDAYKTTASGNRNGPWSSIALDKGIHCLADLNLRFIRFKLIPPACVEHPVVPVL